MCPRMNALREPQLFGKGLRAVPQELTRAVVKTVAIEIDDAGWQLIRLVFPRVITLHLRTPASGR